MNIKLILFCTVLFFKIFYLNSQEIVNLKIGGNIYDSPQILANNALTYVPTGSKVQVLNRSSDGFYFVKWKKIQGYMYYSTLSKTPVFNSTNSNENNQSSNNQNVQKSESPNISNNNKEIVSDVDLNIPLIKAKKDNAFALIIGNEDYSTYQTSLSKECNVDFAERDAQVFREYAINVLGIPEENVVFKINAQAIEMNRLIDKMKIISKSLKGSFELIFYYAGHGFPDPITKEPYIIPVDVSGSDLKFAL